jgi:hypothetical protein
MLDPSRLFLCQQTWQENRKPVQVSRAPIKASSNSPVPRFKPRCPDLRKNDHGPIGLKEEFEPVARLEVQVFSHRFWNGDLVFAAEGSFHGGTEQSTLSLA